MYFPLLAQCLFPAMLYFIRYKLVGLRGNVSTNARMSG
jgi:hypothetical protein